MSLRIISLNTGATIKIPGGETTSPIIAIRNLRGISNFLIRKAGEADHTAIALQEIENYILRSAGINQPYYYNDKLGTGWTSRFQRLLKTNSGKLKIYDGSLSNDGMTPYKNGKSNAGFGNAVMSNMRIIKTIDHRYNFNPQEITVNKEEFFQYGFQQKGALATKLSLQGKYMWFINTHFTLELHAIERQLWQLLGLVGSMDPTLPVLITGDLNIWQNGINNYPDDGVTITATAKRQHRRMYNRMCRIFTNAGFVQLGEDTGPSFKPWNLNTRIDYAFLLNPAQYAASVLTPVAFNIERPDNGRNNTDTFFSDHCALLMDFEWEAT